MKIYFSMSIHTISSILLLLGIILYPYFSLSQFGEPTVVWSNAERNDFPWMVRIVANFRHWRVPCSASLISSQWLLTSAHCVQNENMLIATSVVATFGRYDMNKLYEPGQIQRSTSQIFVHPLYRRGNFSWDYNFALIKLNTPVSFRAVSLPYAYRSREICLANYSRYSWPVDSCDSAVAIGWTTPDPAESTNVLRKASVSIQSFSGCEEAHRVPRGSFSRSKSCAPANSGRSNKCLGDSGGPLMCKMNDQVYYLIGVTSYGPLECNIADSERLPDFHGRVCAIIPWLRSVAEGISETTFAPSCGLPPWIYNGLVEQGSITEGSVRNITCFIGRYILGPDSIKCVGGSWTAPGSCINT